MLFCVAGARPAMLCFHHTGRHVLSETAQATSSSSKTIWRNRMSLPLAGVKVVDLTAVISGPLATYQLALLGADVIKVEVQGVGDIARKLGPDQAMNQKMMGVSFWALNAGKKSVSLNLKTEKGREVLKRLVMDADVIAENFRP